MGDLTKHLACTIFAIAVAAGSARADFVTDTITTGANPFAVAVNPVTNRTYVANYGSGTVTVIDAATGQNSTISVGASPRAIAVNALTDKIYVANFTGSSVSVIDGSTNTVIATVSVQSNPNAIAINPATGKIYITNYGSANVSVINDISNAVDATIPVGLAPIAVCVNPVTNRIYVANSGSDNVTVIDGATNNTTTVTAGTTPYSITANTVTNKIYVANQGSNNVTVIDGATNGTTTIAVGTSPSAIAVNLVTDTIYVANSGSNNVTVIDGATGAASNVTVGTNPVAVAVNTTTNKIYVANYGSNSISVITGASLTATITTGTNQNAIAVNTITNKIYVANYGSGNVTLIDGATYSTTIAAAGVHPIAVAVNPVTNKVYFVNVDLPKEYMTAFDGMTYQRIDSVSLSSTTPWAWLLVSSSVVVNPVTNKIHVTNTFQDNPYPPHFIYHVWVIDGVTNEIVSSDSVPIPPMNRSANVNPVANKTYIVNHSLNTVTVIDGATNSANIIASDPLPLAVAVNPVINKIYVADDYGGDGTVWIDETPASDTKLRVSFDSLPNIGFYNSTFLAQPSITGKAVNRLRSGHTGISRVLTSKTTAQSSWDNASITGGVGTDSVSWEWVWGTDTLLFGENLLCAVALDSQTTSTDNPGVGTSFTGNVTVFPIYRLPPPPAAAPVLLSPLDNSVDQPLSTTFSWNTVSGATSYTLQVSSDSLFSSFIFNAFVSGTSRTVSGLAVNATYYWRVNAGNYSGVGPWSSVWRFTIIVIEAPVLSSPANGAVDIFSMSLLSWNTVATATSYSVQVSTDSNFSTTVVNQSNVTDTNYQVTGLLINTVYYWRANASNGVGTGPWSQTWRFTTISTPPASPVLSSPANNALGVSTNPTLTWNTAARATSYTVQVSTDSNFSSIVVNDSGITNLSYVINDLSSFSLYYWRVRAINAVGPSAWSGIRNFMTGTGILPPVPILLSPSNNTINQPTTLILIWATVSGATSYHVQVSTSSSFTPLFIEDSTLADTSKALLGLANNTVYYWRVRAKNGGGTSNWTSRWSFTTIIAAPVAPILVQPVNGDTNQPVTPMLRWSKVNGAVTYHVQVSTSSSFSTIDMEDSLLTDTSKVVAILIDSTTYYWRVKAVNIGGASDWSEVWNFVTGNTGVLPRNPSAPRAFSITGSFGTVRYSLPLQCHVSMKYYDLRGRLTATLVNTMQGPGDYMLSVKNALPSNGSYIRVFEAGSFVKRNLVAMVGK